MKTAIDSAGRVVIPKEIRDRLGLRGAQQVEIPERDGSSSGGEGVELRRR